MLPTSWPDGMSIGPSDWSLSRPRLYRLTAHARDRLRVALGAAPDRNGDVTPASRDQVSSDCFGDIAGKQMNGVCPDCDGYDRFRVGVERRAPESGGPLHS